MTTDMPPPPPGRPPFEEWELEEPTPVSVPPAKLGLRFLLYPVLVLALVFGMVAALGTGTSIPVPPATPSPTPAWSLEVSNLFYSVAHANAVSLSKGNADRANAGLNSLREKTGCEVVATWGGGYPSKALATRAGSSEARKVGDIPGYIGYGVAQAKDGSWVVAFIVGIC